MTTCNTRTVSDIIYYARLLGHHVFIARLHADSPILTNISVYVRPLLVMYSIESSV